jgi:hypothetical protein
MLAGGTFVSLEDSAKFFAHSYGPPPAHGRPDEFLVFGKDSCVWVDGWESKKFED